jgi:hypothetical protein
MAKIFPHRRSRRAFQPRPVLPLVAPIVLDRDRILDEQSREARLRAEKQERTLARLAARRQATAAEDANIARIEAMAREMTFPWDCLQAERDLLEKLGIRANQRAPYLCPALFWGCKLIFGAAMAEVYPIFTFTRLTPREETGGALCPLTLDPVRIAGVIDFLAAVLSAFRLDIDDDKIAEFRGGADLCMPSVLKHRQDTYEQVCKGELTGLWIRQIADGWFRFDGDPRAIPESMTQGVYTDGKRIEVFEREDPQDKTG